MNATTRRQIPSKRRWDTYMQATNREADTTDIEGHRKKKLIIGPKKIDDSAFKSRTSRMASSPQSPLALPSWPRSDTTSNGSQSNLQTTASKMESITASTSQPSGPDFLTSLPTEVLQHIFLQLLLPCLHDTDDGERTLHLAVCALTAVCRTTRSNIISVLRMLRKEISVGGMLIEHCARPHEMRMLVLTLDYQFGTGSAVKVEIGRWRDVRKKAANGEGEQKGECRDIFSFEATGEDLEYDEGEDEIHDG